MVLGELDVAITALAAVDLDAVDDIALHASLVETQRQLTRLQAVQASRDPFEGADKRNAATLSGEQRSVGGSEATPSALDAALSVEPADEADGVGGVVTGSCSRGNTGQTQRQTPPQRGGNDDRR
jgi:hypothetical protein